MGVRCKMRKIWAINLEKWAQDWKQYFSAYGVEVKASYLLNGKLKLDAVFAKMFWLLIVTFLEQKN